MTDTAKAWLEKQQKNRTNAAPSSSESAPSYHGNAAGVSTSAAAPLSTAAKEWLNKQSAGRRTTSVRTVGKAVSASKGTTGSGVSATMSMPTDAQFAQEDVQKALKAEIAQKADPKYQQAKISAENKIAQNRQKIEANEGYIDLWNPAHSKYRSEENTQKRKALLDQGVTPDTLKAENAALQKEIEELEATYSGNGVKLETLEDLAAGGVPRMTANGTETPNEIAKKMYSYPTARFAASAVNSFTSPARLPISLATIYANNARMSTHEREKLLAEIETAANRTGAMKVDLPAAETGGQMAADILGNIVGSLPFAYMAGAGTGGATALGTKAAGSVAAKTGSQALGKAVGGAVDNVLLGLPQNIVYGVAEGNGDAGETLKQIGLGIGIDAASGGLLGGASHGLSKIADGKAAKSGLKTAAQTLDEIDEAYKTVAETTVKNAQLDEFLGPQNVLTARPDFLDDVRAGVRSDGLMESERDLLQALGNLPDGEMRTNFLRALANPELTKTLDADKIDIKGVMRDVSKNAEVLGRASVRADGGSGNGIRQQSDDSALYARRLEDVFDPKESDGRTRYGSSGYLGDMENGGPDLLRHDASFLGELSRKPLSGQDTIGRVLPTEVTENFGGTVFKDDNGNLLSVYHWTNAEFDRFEKGDIGFHGGTQSAALNRKQQKAQNGGWSAGDNSILKECYYNVRNPVFVDDDPMTWDVFAASYKLNELGVISDSDIKTLGNKEGYHRSQYSDEAAVALRKLLRDKGYDGILYTNLHEGGMSVIAFSSDQIHVVEDHIESLAKSSSGASKSFDAGAGFVIGKNATSTGATVEEVVDDLGDAEAFLRGYMALEAPDMPPRITVSGKEWATDDYIRAVQQELPDDPEQLRTVVSQLEDAQADEIAQMYLAGADERKFHGVPVNIQQFAAKAKLNYLELDVGEFGSKTRKFMEIRVPGRDSYTSKELADIVAGRTETYNPKSNEKLVKRARGKLAINKYRKQIYERTMRFDKTDLFSDEEFAAAQLLMLDAEKNGDFKLAANLRQGLSRKLTDAGRTVQAASLLGRMTPEGTLRSAENLLRRQADRKMYAGADEDLDELVRKLTQKLQKLSNQPNLDKASMDELIDETAKRLNNSPYITGAEIKKQLTDTIETLGSRKQQLAKYLKKSDLDTLADRIATVVNNGDLNDVTLRRAFEDVLELPCLSEDEVKEIVKLVNAINEVDDFTLEKAELTEQLYTLIANKQVLTRGERFSSMRKLFMLSNIKTHLRNITSNAFMYGLRKLDDLSAFIIEKVFVKDPEQLTRAIGWKWSRHGQDIMETVNKSTDRAVMKMRHVGKYEMGTNSTLSQYRRHFKDKGIGKALNWLDSVNSGLLEGEDVFFFRRAYKSSLGQIMTARGLTEVTEKIEDEAMDRALQAVFRADNFLSNLGGKAKALMNSDKRSIKIVGQIADIIIPFTKTPANIAQQTVQYSPLGILQALGDLFFRAIGKSKKQTADIVNEFAKGLSGSALLAVGVILGRKGIINTGYGKTAKERAADELAGIQENSVQFGDTSITIDWLQPVSAPLIAGAVIGQQAEEDGVDLGVIFGASLESVDSVLDLTMLQSLYDFFGGYDAGAIGSISSVAENAVSQMIPTAVGQIARAIDPVQRKPSGESVVTDVLGDNGFSKAIQQVMAKVPFVSKMLEPEVDAWGNEVYRTGKVTDENAWLNVFQQIVSPANIKTATGDDEISQLILALYEDQGSRAIPSEPTREKADDLGMSYVELAKLVGKVNRQAVEDLIGDEVAYTVQRENAYGKKKNIDLHWSEMTEDERARVLSRIYTETKKQVEETDDDYFEQLIRAVGGG